MHLPSELEAITVIPALRAMLARELITKSRMKQSEVASLLGITQSAVSNYMTGIRARNNPYADSPAIRHRISLLVKALDSSRDARTVVEGLASITEYIRRNRLMCEVHRVLDPGLDIDTCHICDY